jgi:hypothetical protein
MLTIFDIFALLFLLAGSCFGAIFGLHYGIFGVILGAILGTLLGFILSLFTYTHPQCLCPIFFCLYIFDNPCILIEEITKKLSKGTLTAICILLILFLIFLFCVSILFA